MIRQLRRAGLLALTILLGPAAGVLGWSQPKDLFQGHYDLAVRLYLSLRYEEALKEFQAAYAIKPEPRLLVNLGTTYRRLGLPKEALAAYDSYLKVQSNPTSQEREQIERAMADARGMLAPKAAEPPAAPLATPKARPGVRHKPAPSPDFLVVDTGLNELAKGNGLDLGSIAGSEDKDLWFAGSYGTAIHFDGSKWENRSVAWMMPTPSLRRARLSIGRVRGRLPDSLWGLTNATAPSVLLHFDGERWLPAPALPTTNELVGIWQEGASQLWAMDTSSAVLRYDGTEWSFAPMEGASGELAIRDVSARSPTDVWAVGERGVILHFDGKKHRSELSGTRSSLQAVWAAGASDVWAGGTQASICHFDGKAWTPVSTPITQEENSPYTSEIHGLWGSGPADLWAVGARREKESSSGYPNYVGGVLMHYDGKTWARAAAQVPFPLLAIWGSGPRDVWALGRAAQPLLHFDGTSWTEVTLPGSVNGIDLQDIWGTGPRDVWVVGRDGIILHFDGEKWSLGHSRPANSLRIWKSGAQDIWAAGQYLHHFDGKTWSLVATEQRESLRAFWGSAESSELWAVGDSGRILRRQQGKWTRVGSGTDSDLAAVWGSGPADIWAAGTGGTVLHYAGSGWSKVQTGLHPLQFNNVRDIGGSGPRDVWFRDDSHAVVRYDGNSWQKVTLPPTFSAEALYVRGPSDVWLAGSSAQKSQTPDSATTVLHWNGKGWKPFGVATSQTIRALWSTSSGDIWGAGSDATIVRYRPSQN